MTKLEIQVEGTHFTDSQEKSKVCTHVARAWEKQCMSFQDGIDKMVEDQQVINDIRAPMREFRTVVDTDNCVKLEYIPSGQKYSLTENSIKNLCALGDMSTWQIMTLMEDKVKVTKRKGKQTVWTRDADDADVIKRLIDVHLFKEGRFDLDKNRLFRTWDDGTMRAVLSEEYVIVNNVWYLEALQTLIPGGLLSHWRSDADALYGNVLIPDSIREENDSDYGGMLSVGNSEVGTRRISSLPSVFRAICMNGCIWEQKSGEVISKVHRGKFDFNVLFEQIKANLNKQIPLLDSVITQTLDSRKLTMGKSQPGKVIAAVCDEFRIPKNDAWGVLNEFPKEIKILGKDALTAFGVQCAITRYGQTLEREGWVNYDVMGGNLVRMNEKKWNNVIARASDMTDDEMAEIYGPMFGTTV